MFLYLASMTMSSSNADIKKNEKLEAHHDLSPVSSAVCLGVMPFWIDSIIASIRWSYSRRGLELN